MVKKAVLLQNGLFHHQRKTKFLFLKEFSVIPGGWVGGSKAIKKFWGHFCAPTIMEFWNLDLIQKCLCTFPLNI